MTEAERIRRRILCTLAVLDRQPQPPYLEIEPETVWMTDYGVDNQVYSNTDWNIN